MSIDHRLFQLRTFLLAGAAMPLCLYPIHAGAQQIEPGALEEVVVTAQKRSEGLQQTPIAISAFTSAAIAKLGVNDIQQLAERAPNVTFKFTSPISGASNAAQVFIRGIGQSDFALTTDPGVGMYVDGVYMSRSVGGVMDVLDLEQVEILRGPQGTLFGRNTIGGAISLIGKRPSFEANYGEMQVTGGTSNQLYVRGSLNLALAENFAARIAVSSKSRDGYVKTGFAKNSPFYATALDDLGNENRDAARAAFLWQANDRLKVSLATDYSRARETNAPAVLVGVTGTQPNGPIVFVYNAFEAPGRTLPGFANASYSAANFVTGKDRTYGTGPNGTRLTGWGTALTLDYALSDTVALKSISAFHREFGSFSRDADGSPIELTNNSDYAYTHKQFSQELQLTGSVLDDRLKFATGLYYFHEKGSDPFYVNFPDSFGKLRVDASRVTNKSYAAYAQATYAVTERLSATVGLRYTQDKKSFFTDQYLVPGSAGPIVFGVPAGTIIPLVPRNSDVGQKFTNASPKLTVDYKFDPTALVYATYSKGFKSGGFNLRYVQPRSAVLPYAPEKVNSYEVGTKWQNAARTLQVNAAAFYTDYRDIQLTTFENLGAPVTVNGGDATIKGFELELKAKPFERLNLGASAGYLDAGYDSLRSNPTTIVTPEQAITRDTKLPNTPRWSLVFDADYTVLVTGDATLQFAGSGRYSTQVYNDAQNSVFLRQPSYFLMDASITYAPASQVWSLRAFVTNLTDKRYIVSGDSNYGIGFHQAEYNRPREFGATLTYRF